MPARYSAIFLLLALALAARAAADTPRVVSLSPSLTAILLALDAMNALVGVDEVSAQAEPRVRALPRVGGLFNPSLEAIVALRPSAVALVPSAQQRELRERLEALGIEVLALPNIRYRDVLNSIVLLGAHVGRDQAARARVDVIEKAWGEARANAARGPHVRTVLVLQREPLYVVGRGSFLDTMLECAGAENLAREFDDPYPRVSVEWLIAAAPELILDAADPAAGARAHWSHWPSLPAVAKGRVEVLDRSLTIPGPYLDRSLAELSAHVRAAGRSR
jgi:iron complex transport system substrate-binding protein